MAGTEKRMLSGWKSITWGLSVIGLFAAALLFVTSGPAAAIACAGSALALMLLSAVLEWMGEVENHLRRIAEDTARSVDRQNGISAKIAKALGCRIDDLFPEMDETPGPEGKPVSADGFDDDSLDSLAL